MNIELEMDILKLKILGLSNCKDTLKNLQFILHKDTWYNLQFILQM